MWDWSAVRHETVLKSTSLRKSLLIWYNDMYQKVNIKENVTVSKLNWNLKFPHIFVQGNINYNDTTAILYIFPFKKKKRMNPFLEVCGDSPPASLPLWGSVSHASCRLTSREPSFLGDTPTSSMEHYRQKNVNTGCCPPFSTSPHSV